ncbi:right-handed parallel beta-helix repeat-containing protein [uncultured Paraglaciecola sp.]|uniref:right-handed parallel beta-helix repeat-containing protein n=1 Tax=uncultured Paraglaciecola sp. TaxID=1765024 RepID=UPI002639C5E8|nr:right-handed parallel beta-helix repeat-containing protein [uncultured Paraglaciecola sp.]
MTNIAVVNDTVEAELPSEVSAADWYEIQKQIAEVTGLSFFTPEMFNAADTYAAGTDDRAAVNAAITAAAAAKGTVLLNRKYRLNSGAVIMVANARMIGKGPSTGFVSTLADTPGISCTGIDDCVLSDFSLDNETAHTSAFNAGVKLYQCNRFLIERLTLTNMGHSGIFLHDSNDCIVRDNTLSNWLGDQESLGNGNGIGIYSDSSRNVIENNKITACGWHGILIQDPDGTSGTPTDNEIRGNRIKTMWAYGIANYMVAAGKSSTIIEGNRIEDIDGGVISSGQSGAGIYCVGAGSGGVIISKNHIKDCCKSTAGTTLAPGCIGVTGIALGDKVIVSENILEADRYDGVRVSSCPGQVVSSKNTIKHSSGNTQGSGILYSEANGDIDGNQITMSGDTVARGIFIYSPGALIKQLTVRGNTILNNSYRAIDVLGNASTKLGFITIDGNIINTTVAGGTGCYIVNADGMVVKGNIFKVGNVVLYVSNAAEVSFTGNLLKTALASNGIQFVNANTDSRYDASNVTDTTVLDSSTGMTVE